MFKPNTIKMSRRRLADISGSISVKKRTPVRAAPPSTFVPQSQEDRTSQQISEISELDQLKSVPGIGPFLISDLIPDLLYLLEQGRNKLEEAIQIADPNDPTSIIFNNPLQAENKATSEVEISIILNEPDVEESKTLECPCGSKKIQVAYSQTRSADEPMTMFTRCIKCKRRGKQSLA